MIAGEETRGDFLTFFTDDDTRDGFFVFFVGDDTRGLRTFLEGDDFLPFFATTRKPAISAKRREPVSAAATDSPPMLAPTTDDVTCPFVERGRPSLQNTRSQVAYAAIATKIKTALTMAPQLAGFLGGCRCPKPEPRKLPGLQRGSLDPDNPPNP